MFERIIKITGKSFNDLDREEIASMIEADSSLSPEGNESFSNCALDEFLHNADLSRPDLIELRDEILRNIYVDVEGSRAKEINTKYLKKIAADLRSQSTASGA